MKEWDWEREIGDKDVFRCEECGKYMSGLTVKQQHEMILALSPRQDIYTEADFHHRICPMCKMVARIVKTKTSMEVDNMDMDEIMNAQKETAPEYIDIGHDEYVTLKLTGAKLSTNKFGNPAVGFKVLEFNGETPLNEKAKWEAGAASVVRAFLKKFEADSENAEAMEFTVKVKRTGEGNQTRYAMEFVE